MSAEQFDQQQWYDAYQRLVRHELGIELTTRDQDGLGSFPDPERLVEFCAFHLRHTDLHPIARSDSVDQILGSLAQKFERADRPSDEELALIRKIVVDAQTNCWACSMLLVYADDYDAEVDPGEYAVSQWLHTEAGLDFELIARQKQRLSDDSLDDDLGRSEESIAELLTRYRGTRLLDENGQLDSSTLDLSPPASDDDIEKFACSRTRPDQRELPAQLVELWKVANGGCLWGHELLGTMSSGDYIDGFMDDQFEGELWISFHAWGNGDFDFIVTHPSRKYPDGSIVFFSHETGRYAPVSGSLREWLHYAIGEITTAGGLAHPYDYQFPGYEEADGMYRKVYEEIRD